MVGMKQRIKSLLLMEGMEFPTAPAGSQWSFMVKNKLRKLPCSGTVRFKLDQWLDSLEFNEKQVLKTTREIRRFCHNDPELSQCIEYTMSGSGIGWIVASQLLARIGDWRELRNIRQLGGFLGLVPTEHSTGERTDRGSITHTGDERLRSKMIQASWSAIRKDAELREFFRLICHRHPRRQGPRVAIVAVAGKLSVRVFFGLVEKKTNVGGEKGHLASFNPEEKSYQGKTLSQAETG